MINWLIVRKHQYLRNRCSNVCLFYIVWSLFPCLCYVTQFDKFAIFSDMSYLQMLMCKRKSRDYAFRHGKIHDPHSKKEKNKKIKNCLYILVKLNFFVNVSSLFFDEQCNYFLCINVSMQSSMRSFEWKSYCNFCMFVFFTTGSEHIKRQCSLSTVWYRWVVAKIHLLINLLCNLNCIVRPVHINYG